MTMYARLMTGLLRPLNTSSYLLERRAFSTENNHSIFSLFKRIFPSDASSHTPVSKQPQVILLPEQELKELCDRNFERQLKEIAEKAKQTASITSKKAASKE
ncbi:MAG: hypothetical protein JSR93_03890 [Verrucomicrobia bacterium]|nr:hypothetical protein [Verrucomicrobiota bacterium]